MIGHSPYLLLLVLLPGLGSLLAHVVQGWSAASVRDKARMAGRFEMLGLGAALLLGVLVVRGYVSWNATLDAPGYLVQPLWSFLSGGRLAAALGLALDPAGALMALAVLFAAFIAVLVRRPEQYGSVEGSGATAGALLLVILADGPVTAGMGWGALLASRALRTSRTHLVPLAGLAVLIGVLAGTDPAAITWDGLGTRPVDLGLGLVSSAGTTGLVSSAFLLLLLPAMGIWPFTPFAAYRRGAGDRAEPILALGPGTAAVVLAARCMAAMHVPAQVQLALATLGGITACLGFAEALRLARVDLDASIRYAGVAATGLAVVALGLDLPGLAMAMEAAFVLGRCLVLAALPAVGAVRTGLGRFAVLVGGASLALFPLTPGFAAGSRAVTTAFGRVVPGALFLSPVAVVLLLLAWTVGSAWLVELDRSLRIASTSSERDLVSGRILGVAAGISLLAGVLGAPGFSWLDEVTRQWGGDPGIPDVEARAYGILLVGLSGACLAIYGMLKKGQSDARVLSGPILGRLLGVGSALGGDRLKGAIERVIFIPLATVSDRVVLRFSEGLLGERILFEGVGFLVSAPWALVRRAFGRGPDGRSGGS